MKPVTPPPTKPMTPPPMKPMTSSRKSLTPNEEVISILNSLDELSSSMPMPKSKQRPSSPPPTPPPQPSKKPSKEESSISVQQPSMVLRKKSVPERAMNSCNQKNPMPASQP